MKKPNRTETRDSRRFQWASRCWLIALVLLPLIHGGCTAALWEQRGPDKRVWIPASQITEEELRQQGRKYETIRMTKQGLREMGITSQEDEVDGYLAEKSRRQKLGDSVVLAVATPVTVVIDGVVVCGVVVGCVAVVAGLDILRDLPQSLPTSY